MVTGMFVRSRMSMKPESKDRRIDAL